MANYEVNEKFRELCSLGDLALIKAFYHQNNPEVNSKNKVNGWSALHWAAKRNHLDVVNFLIQIGANINSLNNDEKPAGFYSKDSEIRKLLLQDEAIEFQAASNEKPAFIPNYLKNPEFHYSNTSLYSSNTIQSQKEPNEKEFTLAKTKENLIKTQDETKLSSMITIRIKANTDEDFIEIDIDKAETSFDEFKEICRKELNHVDDLKTILKIRKLPNILIRNTKDIRRLRNEQEIEVVLI